ncbi:hypothetical protein D3C77_02180 [compost metagenome]|uniref:hypothetical protein n=1 Tax=Pseudomonas TaxID=286 RepID=UPI00040D8A5E|nr:MULTISPECIES: hypothetical protein [Pseudomonas]PRA61951.1 hypothetical protein CQ065_16930 [Pseudomonas sp. MYb187]
MGDFQETTLRSDAIESFLGRIYMLDKGREIPLRLSQTRDKFTWGLTPEYDWLQAGGAEPPPVFNFVFHSQSESRLHFNILGTGQSAAKRLGSSRNGYLGLYEHAEVKDYWKLEPLDWRENDLVCHWRDHRGHRVNAIPDTPHYQPGAFYQLNVEQGRNCEFLVRRIG